jgi:hypothetical protein
MGATLAKVGEFVVKSRYPLGRIVRSSKGSPEEVTNIDSRNVLIESEIRDDVIHTMNTVNNLFP